MLDVTFADIGAFFFFRGQRAVGGRIGGRAIIVRILAASAVVPSVESIVVIAATTSADPAAAAAAASAVTGAFAITIICQNTTIIELTITAKKLPVVNPVANPVVAIIVIIKTTAVVLIGLRGRARVVGGSLSMHGLNVGISVSSSSVVEGIDSSSSVSSVGSIVVGIGSVIVGIGSSVGSSSVAGIGRAGGRRRVGSRAGGDQKDRR
mmetsp:Transcript_8666/g.18277  ORF Transcript_8666/g.18277 Transcript_8666/m.18277 type:complete len:208 (+) Transcript_8666:1281-1904(+)